MWQTWKKIHDHAISNRKLLKGPPVCACSQPTDLVALQFLKLFWQCAPTFFLLCFYRRNPVPLEVEKFCHWLEWLGNWHKDFTFIWWFLWWFLWSPSNIKIVLRHTVYRNNLSTLYFFVKAHSLTQAMRSHVKSIKIEKLL